MRSFFIGAFGALVVLIAAALIAPLYSDYTQRVISNEILLTVELQQKQIEKYLLAKIPVEEGVSPNTIKHIQFIKIQNNGVIFVKATKEGQMLVLTPTIKDNAVIWSCVGSPNMWVPPECRGT